MGCLAIDFWRVRQQDREFIVRYLRSGLFDVVDPEVMRVIDTGQMKSLIVCVRSSRTR